MHDRHQPRFLIIDSYPREARQRMRRHRVVVGWEAQAAMLRRHLPTAAYDVLTAYDPETPHPDAARLSGYDGILWTGSNKRIYDREDPCVAAMIELAHAAFVAGTPGFGTCWGLQLAVTVAGGSVEPMVAGRELGTARNTRLTESGRAHPMYRVKTPVFAGLVCHEDEVTSLPASATLLAEGTYSRVQAVEVRHANGTYWGLQYHPEFTVGTIGRIVAANLDKFVEEGFFATVAEARRHAASLLVLDRRPHRKDLRWQLHLGNDLLDPDVRQREFANWLEHLVIPTAEARGRRVAVRTDVVPQEAV